MKKTEETPHWPYWQIHDKLYDLESWLEKHPGGSDFLLRLQGKDCTAAFEVHHPNISLVRSILDAYEIKQDDKPEKDADTSVPQFNWQPYNELRQRVFKKLQAKSWQPGPSLHSRSIAALLLIINISIPFLWDSAGAFAWLLGLFYAMNLIYVSGYGHMFLHLNTRWEFLGDLGGFSSYEWKGTHCLEHHLYVNDPKYDPDATALLPLLDFRPDYSTPLQRYTAFFVLPLYAAAFMLIRFQVAVNLFNNRQYFWKRLALYLMGSFGWLALWWWVDHLFIGILLEALASLIFLSWTLSTHNHESCHKTAGERDFVSYQLQGSKDFGSIHYGLSLFFGAFLGSQAIHHLFPTLDPIYYPIIEKELHAMGYTYERHHFWPIFWGHLRFVC